ncbi:hypothetical protein WBP07_22975 (plasmid) [Novosphingobium sp. BL-8A]|uniref:hypothetical protein n=1 Tax=Novosphingobium sp. BL-8A TaxID=3127639 RepID=UPI00375747DC
MNRRVGTILVWSFAATFCVTAAHAAPPVVKVALPAQVAAIIGNTLHYRTVDGALEMYLFSTADGRYSAMIVPKEIPPFYAEGSWQVEDGKICRTQSAPSVTAGPPRICEPYVAYPTLGATGEMLDGKMRIDLIAGRAMQ